MRKINVLATAALALTTTAAFAADGQQRFTHAGNTYVYTTRADGVRTIITGRQLPSGDSFRLVVNGDRVTGTSAGQPVAFRTASARGAAGGVQTAAY